MTDYERISDANPISKLVLFDDDDGTLWLSRLEIREDKRGQGHGSKIMKMLCMYADNEGIRLGVDPDPKDLGTWYERFGFKPEYGLWFREPWGLS